MVISCTDTEEADMFGPMCSDCVSPGQKITLTIAPHLNITYGAFFTSWGIVNEKEGYSIEGSNNFNFEWGTRTVVTAISDSSDSRTYVQNSQVALNHFSIESVISKELVSESEEFEITVVGKTTDDEHFFRQMIKLESDSDGSLIDYDDSILIKFSCISSNVCTELKRLIDDTNIVRFNITFSFDHSVNKIVIKDTHLNSY